MLREQIIGAIAQHVPDSPKRLTYANQAALEAIGLSGRRWREFAARGRELQLSSILPALDKLGYRLHDSDGNPVEPFQGAAR